MLEGETELECAVRMLQWCEEEKCYLQTSTKWYKKLSYSYMYGISDWNERIFKYELKAIGLGYLGD